MSDNKSCAGQVCQPRALSVQPSACVYQLLGVCSTGGSSLCAVDLDVQSALISQTMSLHSLIVPYFPCDARVAAYLTWSKLTSNEVVCPVAGCSSILSSQYAQIGPVPLPALGMLGYGSVAVLSVLSAFKGASSEVSRKMNTPMSSEQAILAGVLVRPPIAAALHLVYSENPMQCPVPCGANCAL